jgi:LytS/YehU family sensor histidine kinase
MLEISKEETVELAQEWEFLENYISLERLRLREDCSIKIGVTGDLSGKAIAPMLLIPFVENSFKHGVGAAGDFVVTIALKVTNEKLTFTVKNNLPPDSGTGHKSPSTKSGLKNVKRRLELLYPQGHRLRVKEKDKTFKVCLEITL